MLDTGLNCVTINRVEIGFGATVEPPITAIRVTGRKATRTVSRKATVNRGVGFGRFDWSHMYISGWHGGYYVGQVLVHKDLVEGRLTQQLGRSKKQTVLTLRSKLYDLSFSVPSTKSKIKRLLLTKQSQGGVEWINPNHEL